MAFTVQGDGEPAGGIDTTLRDSTALRAFRDSLADMIFLDPACGCGNFLVVAYRELRLIETDIIVALRGKEGQHTASMDVSLDQRMNIGQFHGFELNWWPAKIAETAMFLVDHQANRALAAAVGDAPDRLPIAITAHIAHGNALTMDWEQLIPCTKGPTFVFGNPPFVGKSAKSKQQIAEMKEIRGKHYTGYLDYVTAWHAKSSALLTDRGGSFAFVTTNSIVQGQQTPALFGPLQDQGWHVSFAHRTFAWDSDAPGKAAVHCVIVGFTTDTATPCRLWEYANLTGDPTEVPLTGRLNAYLVEGPEVLVARRSKPLSPNLNPAQTGSYPADGGNFTVTSEQYEEVAADPLASKYLRPYMGSRELLHNEARWCLWLKDVEAADLQKSRILRERLERVRTFREASTNPGTHRMAAQPQLFVFDGERTEPYLCLPSVVSENRRYFTCTRLEPETIVTNLAFTVDDPDGLHFALASSSLFIVWQKAIGGRLKNDVRFGNTLTWNNFPVPDLTDEVRETIIAAGRGVLDARSQRPERTLADAYNPLAMDPALAKAHNALDRVVDKSFGAPKKLTTDRQRLEVLFARYAEMAELGIDSD